MNIIKECNYCNIVKDFYMKNKHDYDEGTNYMLKYARKYELIDK